jgi:hypothetical protein
MNHGLRVTLPGVLPDILHQTAFNLCAALTCSWGYPARLIAGNPLYAAELAQRLALCLGGGGPHRRPVLIWAAPCREDRVEVADALGALPPEGVVLVLAPGRAGRRVLPGVGNGEGTTSPKRHPLLLEEAVRWLAAQGFREEARYGIGGTEYRLWSRLAYLSERLGLADRADRLRARARASLRVDDKRAAASLLALALTSRRPA